MRTAPSCFFTVFFTIASWIKGLVMVEQEIDRIVEAAIIRFLGVRSHRISLPLDLISITSLFLMTDREALLKESPEIPKERFNGETFFAELTQTGVPVNGLSIKHFNALVRSGYFSMNEQEYYTAEPAAFILTGLLNRIFPRMQGLLFVSYFIQTIEEVKSGRKTEEQALDQAEQLLASQGRELAADSFSPEEKKYLKKCFMEVSQGRASDKTNDPAGQASSKRDKLFNVLAIRMKKKEGLPPFPLHAARLKEVLERDERSVKNISEVVMTDFPMVMRLLEYVNSRNDLKEKTGIASVSKALWALGCDKAKGVVQKVFSLLETDEPLLKNERELLCRFAFLKSIAARNLALSLDAENVEEICVNVMFHQFGLILILYYLPEAYEAIRRITITRQIDADSAAREVLGATCETIGIKVGTDWGLPFSTLESMKSLQQKRAGLSKSTLLRSMPRHIHDMCLAYGQMELDEENSIKTLTLIAESLSIPRNNLTQMLDGAWAEFDDHFSDDHPKMDRESFFKGVLSIVSYDKE